MNPVHHHVLKYNKNETPMFRSVIILLYFLTQIRGTAYKVNDIKCDIQCMDMEVDIAMSSSVTGTA
jgi:hypothetical protein